jgi:hypothetical protein
MEDPSKRKREWSDAECAYFAALDSSSDPKEFLTQIYREASNGNQDPDARIAKTLAKCSALFVRLSDDQTRMSKRLEKYTFWLILLTVILSILTAYLCVEAYYARQNSQLETEQAK